MSCKLVIEFIFRAILPPFYSFRYFERVCIDKVTKNPTDIDALWIWGNLYYIYDRYSEAKQIFELTLDITISKGVGNRGVRSILAELYWKNDDFDKVIDIIDADTLLMKDATCFYFGDSLMRKGKYAECIVYIKRYIRLCKYRINKLKGFGFHRSGLAFWDLGYAYFMIEDYCSAIDAYSQAQILMPEEKGIQEGIECCLERITVQ